jgi:hypothetical protein
MKTTSNNPFMTYNAPAGSMFPELIINSDTGELELALLIKEDTKYILRHKYNPAMEFKTALIRINNVMVMPMMLLVNRDFDMLYESYFNYYRTGEDGDLGLKALTEQHSIHVIFFNEQNEKARAIRMDNRIKEDIEEIRIRLANMKPWTMDEFDVAKAESYKTFPTPEIMWGKLRQIEGCK